MQRSIVVLVVGSLLLAAPAPLSSSVLPPTARAFWGAAARCPGASAGADWVCGGGPVMPPGDGPKGWVLALRGGARAAGLSEDASAMAEEGPEPPFSSRVPEADARECVAQDDHGWSDELNVSSLVQGPYDPESEPNPLGDSSTTLSDASSDPLFPEAEQRQFRQMLKQHDADHGPPQSDRYVGTTYPVLERVLHKSDYKTYWRPGIINKRLWAAAETGDDQEIMFAVHCLEADVNTVDLNIYNYTALFWASMNGHDKTVELLIRLGARVNATDIYGSNALHYATDRGWPKVVEVLGKAGIHSWHRNEFGRTALDWAMDVICTYNASRTPIEDKFRFVANRVVHGGRDGEVPHIAGCNWETVWVLRQIMGLPPLDKPHRTGLLESYRQWARKYRKTVRKRRQHPRTVFDMPPLLPDGTAFDDGIVLDRLPRKVSSPFYRAPENPMEAVWPEGYPEANKKALDDGFEEPPYPYIPKNSMLHRPWMLPAGRASAGVGGGVGARSLGRAPPGAARRAEPGADMPDSGGEYPPAPPPPPKPPRPPDPVKGGGPSAPPPPPRPPKPPPPPDRTNGDTWE